MKKLVYFMVIGLCCVCAGHVQAMETPLQSLENFIKAMEEAKKKEHPRAPIKEAIAKYVSVENIYNWLMGDDTLKLLLNSVNSQEAFKKAYNTFKNPFRKVFLGLLEPKKES
jgi:hypothetical protein